MSDPAKTRHPLGSPELIPVVLGLLERKLAADPARFDGVGFVFAERYRGAPAGCESWHVRIDGRAFSAGPGVPDDVDVLVEADYEVAARIAAIPYAGDPEAKARANALIAEASAQGRARVDVRDLQRAMSAAPLDLTDDLHDALAARVTLPSAAAASPESDSSRFATHRGQRIHYTVHGRGPLVILQHGGLSDATSWAMSGFTAQLTDAFRVASVDSLAHGQSDRPTDPDAYRLRQRAGDLVAVMDDLGESRAHVMGYSMGGWMASGMALHFPEKLASLTIAGWDVENGMHTAAGSMGLERITADVLFRLAREASPALAAVITPEREESLRLAVDAIYEIEGTADAVARLKVPVLLWDGRDDPYHDPMQRFAAKHDLHFLSTGGDHVGAMTLHGAEAAREIRARVLGG